MARRVSEKENTITVSPFYKEDEFSYFCRFDELTGVIACPGVTLPTLQDSCYVSCDEDETAQ